MSVRLPDVRPAERLDICFLVDVDQFCAKVEGYEAARAFRRDSRQGWNQFFDTQAETGHRASLVIRDGACLGYVVAREEVELKGLPGCNLYELGVVRQLMGTAGVTPPSIQDDLLPFAAVVAAG